MKLKNIIKEIRVRYLLNPGKLYVVFHVPYRPPAFVEISDMNEAEEIINKYSEYVYIGVFKLLRKNPEI